MPRVARQCAGGYVYHVWNRAAGRLRLFKKPDDYLAFHRILRDAHQRHPIRVLDWCLMPNHWHFVVYPSSDTQVTAFFRWLTHTHAVRAVTHRRTLGMGPLYQGRFKTLPVQTDEHLLTLLRYVQRNPLRAKLVSDAADWRWSGEWIRRHARDEKEMAAILADWPIDRPPRWLAWVNTPQTPAEVEAIRQHIRRSAPFGDAKWTGKVVRDLGLQWTQRPRGRPAKTQQPLKELRPAL